MKRKIESKGAPAAIGPYSQAIEVNGTLYIAGQLPLIPGTGEAPEGITAQTKQSLMNIKAIVEEAGGSMENIVKCAVYLKDFNDFAAMNEEYVKHFKEPYPARLCFEVARLPRDAKVEIDSTAVL